MHIEDEIRNLLEKEVEKKDVRIDSIKLEKEDNNLFLRIVIDSDEIIDVDKCVEVTNIINPLLDEKDLIKESYILDVSTKREGKIEMNSKQMKEFMKAIESIVEEKKVDKNIVIESMEQAMAAA